MLKPFAPVMMDRFAHAFAEAEHIATVHAIYGEHHLENKLADMAAENENSKSRHTLTGNCDIPFHIATSIKHIIFLSHKIFNTYLLFLPLHFVAVCISPDDRPPWKC